MPGQYRSSAEAVRQFLKDFENYNLSRITEIRQACYDRYLAR
jgi:hypothetical protein